jgi:hypothetical protein
MKSTIDHDVLNAADRDALERAMTLCRSESKGRAAQIDAKLQDESWESVACFAAVCSQTRLLALDPWQTPPLRASLNDLTKPRDDSRGERRAAELLEKLLRAGLSRFEPDPVAALERAT